MISTRGYWLGVLERVCRKPLEAMAAGNLRTGMPCEKHPDCEGGRLATVRLELAGRLLDSIAPWLECAGVSGEEQALQAEFRELARKAIAIGCDSEHPDYWTFEKHPQALVDAAFFAQALMRAPAALWDPLTPETKDAVVRCLGSLRDRAPYFNNWLLFSACTEAFLAKAGADWDPMRVDFALRQHEQWYLGDGTYADGPDYHHDYYNSFVIQPFLVEILEVVAPLLDGRWQGLVTPVRERMRRHAAIQERQIHSDGTWPVVGRSICYRTGAFNGLAVAAWKDLLPAGLPPAQARCALTAALRRGLAPSENFDEAGWLRIGLHGSQPALGEPYITTASLYLAGFIFAALGRGPETPFWAEADLPWTAVRIWEKGENAAADAALRSCRRST